MEPMLFGTFYAGSYENEENILTLEFDRATFSFEKLDKTMKALKADRCNLREKWSHSYYEGDIDLFIKP